MYVCIYYILRQYYNDKVLQNITFYWKNNAKIFQNPLVTLAPAFLDI